MRVCRHWYKHWQRKEIPIKWLKKKQSLVYFENASYLQYKLWNIIRLINNKLANKKFYSFLDWCLLKYS